MAIVAYTESSLSRSEIYATYKKAAREDPLERIKKLIANAKQLTNRDIEIQYIQVKQYRNSLSQLALKAYDEGRTVLLYNEDPKLTINPMLPFITLRSGDKYRTYVFMDHYIRKRKDGSIILNSAELHDLLVGAVISNAIRSDYFRLTTNSFLEKTLMNLYTSFVCRILNREYLLGPEKIVYDTIQYYFNRFFLERVFESEQGPDNIDLLAKSNLRYLDPIKLESAKSTYDQTNPQTISQLLDITSQLLPRMETLNLRLFLNNWINYYLPPATMAIDNIEYLIFMIETLKNGNNIVNHIAADIVKEAKNIKILDNELLKLIQ